jgi:signal peptidase
MIRLCSLFFKVLKGNVELNTVQANFQKISQELLDSGLTIRFLAHGQSMYPFIRDEDILIVKPLDDRPVNSGDIIFCSHVEGAFVAHRLIKTKKAQGSISLYTKGDSLRYYDPPVLPEKVLGRVIQIERRGKRLILTNWPWCIFGVLIAYFARGRYYNQDRVVRNLGRLWWITGGRRLR